MRQEMLTYAIVRVVPNLWRDETLNIGIIANHSSKLYTRFLKTATRALAALAPPTIVSRCLRLESVLRQRYSEQDELSAGFIDGIAREGIDGFFVSPSNVMELGEPTEACAEQVVEKLYDELVKPPVWHSERALKVSAPLSNVMDEIVQRSGVSPTLIAKKLQIKTKKIDRPFSIDYAYANGSLSFVKTVDLDVATEHTRLNHVYEAIAVSAQVDRILRKQPHWISVVTLDAAAEPEKYLQHLRVTSEVLCLPSDAARLADRLREEAREPVKERLEKELGLPVLASDHGLEVIAEA